MQSEHLTITDWPDYELLDSGDHLKLERFGSIIVSRPETQALWHPNQPALWQQSQADFRFAEGKGRWTTKKQMPKSWPVTWRDATLIARLASFKHVGLFPEQATNWEWMVERLKNIPNAQVLNLFGYTGAASIIAARNNAQVTHVDASKHSIEWAKENARTSGLGDTGICYLLDDAIKFAKREVRRGSHYHGIILDPPDFGRGPKGEVWHIEEDLPVLVDTLKILLFDTPGSFFLLNGYAAGYTPLSFAQLVTDIFGKATGEYGELYLQESHTDRALSAGIYTRFVR